MASFVRQTFELTGITPNLSLFNNKFGQPGTAPIVGDSILTHFDSKVRHRSKLDPNNEFVVALGSPAHDNHSILVIIPGRRTLLPSWRHGFRANPTNNREITYEEQQRMTISDDSADLTIHLRVPDIASSR